MTNDAPDKANTVVNANRYYRLNGKFHEAKTNIHAIEYIQADKANTSIQELCTHLARVLSIINSHGDELSPDLDVGKIISDATDVLLKHDDEREYIDPRDDLIRELENMVFRLGVAVEHTDFPELTDQAIELLAKAKEFLK